MPDITSFRTESSFTSDIIENIGCETGTITEIHSESDTADVSCGQTYNDVPVFYNSPESISVQKNGSLKRSSDAFARGDEVIIRMYNGKPSHIIGFKDDIWPCIKTPAWVFSDQIADFTTNTLRPVESQLFYERYKSLQMSECSTPPAVHIDETNPDVSSGFSSVQRHWTDNAYHRETKLYYNGELICETYNNETYSNIFNGNRPNVIGSYIHPDTGWGCLVYQINTFHNWQPLTSGRVNFDCYLYLSSGLHIKITSALSDISGESSPAFGSVVSSSVFKASGDERHGSIFSGEVRVNHAGEFTSDGSTNELESSEGIKSFFCMVSEGTELPVSEIFTLEADYSDGSNDDYKIYVKNR